MKKVVVVNPGESGIYVTVMAGNEVRKTMAVDIEPGSGLNTENMRRVSAVLREEGIRNCSAATVLSDDQCIFRTVKDEKGDPDRIYSKLMSMLDEHPSCGEDEYIFDYQPASGDPAGNEYLCVATRKSVVIDYQAAFVRNNLRLDYLIPECVAIGNIIKSSGIEGERNIFMDLNRRKTMIRVYDGRECIAQHEIITEETDRSEQIGRIRMTLDYYDENGIADCRESGVYVYGECAVDKSMVRLLKKELGCELYPVRGLLGCAITGSDASRMFSAMGVLSREVTA